jgi:glutamyl-Q tRNA(Asp) synthetase
LSPPVHPRYRGRFAPSPSGRLHFGSLVTALGSRLDARTQGGEWLVRMEDLDPPREQPGAADDILRTLEAFGLTWDGPVLYQSRRHEHYREALGELARQGAAYACSCSRKEVAEAGAPGPEGPLYPGTCRGGPRPGRDRHAWRIRADVPPVAFVDRRYGPQQQSLEREVGDFVVLRADGLFAYQLAVVVDDAAQGINQVVRGADLLLSTPRQIHLQRLLGLPTPSYLHLPLVLDEQGRKLSKQSRSQPVDPRRPLPALLAAWAFLGQLPPPEAPPSVEAFHQWALGAWQPGRLGMPDRPWPDELNSSCSFADHRRIQDDR